MRADSLSQFLKNGDAALIISEKNREYFTSFSSSNGYLIISKNGNVFITDSRYIEAASNEIKNCEIIEQKNIDLQIAQAAADLGCNKILLESERVTIAQAEHLKKALPGFKICYDGKLDKYIDNLRRIKDESEKENILKAQKITENAFEYILKYIKTGMSEKELSIELNYFMLKNGADSLAFDTILISGANTSMPHGVPTGKKIEHGDFITMDFGAVVDGYHSDMTRTVAIGSVCDKQVQIYNTVLKAQLETLAVIKAGMKGSECDKVARDIITDAGYGNCFGHGTGHGVGIEIHENPTLSPSFDECLNEGNIVTVEPGIYIPHEFGVRIEDMVYVLKDGCENLTKAKKDLIVLPD